jgi:hypothetical protein
MSRTHLRKIKKKRKLWPCYTRTREYEDYLKYKATVTKLKKTIIIAKKAFEES